MAGEVVKFEAPRLPSLQASTMEQVLLQGDLERLPPDGRLAYYDSVCKSLGLNPLTRPFEYVKLQGKTTLYAKRECTEQLRMLHSVSVRIVARETVEGCYIVTAQATLPSGRHDESIGAVSIEGLKGENRSNAMMKAETKAKRRVTLSICGLAFMDESETVPGAVHVPVDAQTGEIIEEPVDATPYTVSDAPPATGKPKGGKTFDHLAAFAALKKRFQDIGQEPEYYAVLGAYGKEKSNQFGADEMDKARTCYRAMNVRISALETKLRGLPVEKLPDPVELTVGTRLWFEGKTWEVWDSPEGFDFREVPA